MKHYITPRWSLSEGVRQTWDTKHMVSQPSFAAATPAGIADVKASFSKLTVEAGAEDKLSRGKLAYFRFAQGYRSSGVNGDAPTVAGINSYEPETVLRPTRQFTVTGSLGYLHTRYDQQFANIGVGPDTILADLRKEYAPKLTGLFAMDYRIPLNGGYAGSMTLGGDVNYRSSFTTNPVDNPVGFQSEFALVNAAITYRTADERYFLSVYGRNLTDKYYITNGEVTGGVGLFQAVGRPRIWGIRGTARF